MSMTRSHRAVARPRKRSLFGLLLRLSLVFVTVGTCALAAAVLFWQWDQAQRGAAFLLEGGSPHLNPAERAYLASYLALNRERLAEPAGTGRDSVTFTVNPGENANQIAANLEAAGLLRDRQLFLNYVRFHGLDGRLEAGAFQIDPHQTVPELTTTLTHARAQEVELRFVEGRRLEEIAEYLEQVEGTAIDPAGFLAIAQRRVPFDLSGYDFLQSLPATATLEGFLFPDTYRVPPDADAAYLVHLMLSTFGRRATPTMRQAYGVHGLTIYEAVTLAAIVEREAAVPAERPVMAGVFLNRLALGMRLEADPTVQYALGHQPETGQWWKSPLTLNDLQYDSPYNTYRYAGLPPGPIANPGLAALQAVADPANVEYLFFVTDCDAAIPGAHVFSRTYEEHLAHVLRCR
jgi:UPF0755 protein